MSSFIFPFFLLCVSFFLFSMSPKKCEALWDDRWWQLVLLFCIVGGVLLLLLLMSLLFLFLHLICLPNMLLLLWKHNCGHYFMLLRREHEYTGQLLYVRQSVVSRWRFLPQQWNNMENTTHNSITNNVTTNKTIAIY